MSVALPDMLNYRPVAALPGGTSTLNVATSPSNGSSFAEGAQIICDLTSRGALIPDSLYMSYKYAYTNTVNAEMIGTPAYSPFSSLQVQIGSQTVETIANYNIVMNTLTNLSHTVSDKYGQLPALGYFANTGVPSLEQLDGRTLTANESGSFSAPIICSLTNCDKAVPLNKMPQVRLILTLDSLSNYFTTTIATPTAVAITNFELRYKVLNLSGEVENQVMKMDRIPIKTHSFASSSAVLASGSSGFQEINYNFRFASVKDLIAVNGTGTAGGNKAFDSVELSTSGDDSAYSFALNGQVYPQKSMSTQRGRAQLLQELRSVAGSIFDKHNSMAINAVEFNYNGTAASTTYQAPGKFYVGTNVSKTDADGILSGVDTNNSPIGYRMDLGSSIGANNSTITMICHYDATYVIDPASGEVTYRS
jgi:hypothetical protein|tara:strand:- start:398 stop:1660 length:1263 start_codon:yes stop_codon:yes gene_type:complete